MPWWIWTSFVLFVAALIAIDLGVLHRKSHTIKVREALGWTCLWISVAMIFNVIVYFLYEGKILAGWLPPHELTGKDAAMQFFTGYVVEYSLSVDNIFVIAMIIAWFRVPAEYQHRLLFWGVLGAAILRGIMIGVGAVLIHQFEWTIYLFGALLLFSAVKLLFTSEDEVDPEHNLAVRLTRRLYPVTHEFHGKEFFVDINGRRTATPMLLALVLIESCDVMFAVDSIPAVFAVTRDPFLVFTSNIFAILGLRSLYFALAGMMDKFRYLKASLVFVLGFVGIKMLLSKHLEISNAVSLGIIGGLLFVGVMASIISDSSKSEKPATPPPSNAEISDNENVDW